MSCNKVTVITKMSKVRLQLLLLCDISWWALRWQLVMNVNWKINSSTLRLFACIGCTNLLSLLTLYRLDRLCLLLIAMYVISGQHINRDIYFYCKINIRIKVFCAPTQFKTICVHSFIWGCGSVVCINFFIVICEWVDNSCTKATVNWTVRSSSVDSTKRSVLVMNLMYWYRLHCLHCKD